MLIFLVLWRTILINETYDVTLLNVTVISKISISHCSCYLFDCLGFEPVIGPGHESYVHHMVLYECHVPEDSSDLYFAHHAKGSQLFLSYNSIIPVLALPTFQATSHNFEPYF